jgi:hypothetical protein
VSLADTVRKFRSRTWREIGFVAESFVLLGVIRAAILLFPFRKLTGIMGLTQGDGPSSAEAIMSVNPTAIGWAVQAAAARTPWESACLVQALTGMAMLSRRGIKATLYLGVAKDESGTETMAAHAWLRCGDTILTGASVVERFSAISSFSRPPSDDTRRQPNNDRTGQ